MDYNNFVVESTSKLFTFFDNGDLQIQGTFLGNASTANALTTSRTINGVAFDGSANINLTGLSTNSITFTQDRIYNSFGTPRTGNITHSLTGALDGVTIMIYHSGGSEPTYPTEWKKLATSAAYSTSKVNMIYAQHIDGRVTFLITQEA